MVNNCFVHQESLCFVSTQIYRKMASTSREFMLPSIFFDKSTPRQALRTLFGKYDKDNNGILDKQELSTLLKDDLGMTHEQAEMYSYLLDKEGSQQISYEQFRAWIQSNEHYKTISDGTRFRFLQKAIEIFKRYDADNNQALDKEEFKSLFLDLGGKKKNFKKTINELDRDNNGVISFQEFLRWLNWVELDAVFS